MVGDGAVGSLILEAPVRRHQHAGHHGQRGGRRRDHVAHHVAVVVLARPHHAALAANDLGGDVVDQRVPVVQPRLLEIRPELLIKDLLEQQLERLVVVLGDGVLCAEPHVLPHGQGVAEAAPCEGENGVVPVVHGLHHAGGGEVVHRLTAQLPPALVGEHQLRFPGAGHPVLHRLVQIAVGVPRHRHRLLPARHHRLDPLEQNGSAEHRAVQRRPDGGVGGLPQLFQPVLLLPLQIGGDGGALHAHPQPPDSVRRLRCHRVLRLVPVGQRQIVVFRVQLHKGQKKLLLDHAPQHVGHLVAVQLGDGVCHFDLIHGVISLSPRSG